LVSFFLLPAQSDWNPLVAGTFEAFFPSIFTGGADSGLLLLTGVRTCELWLEEKKAFCG
jgi:hypothetical protein